MTTHVAFDARLGDTVCVFDSVEAAIASDPQEMFRVGQLLVIDGGEWITADIEVIRSGLRAKRRRFKDPFSQGKPTPEVGREVKRLVDNADALFARLYPDFEARDVQSSFRPLITADEPIHFDTRPGAPLPYVTSFINVSRVPRVYKIGPTLHQLVEWHPDLMLKLCRESEVPDDIAYITRKRAIAHLPPLGHNDCPKHTIDLAPLSIWFMDAKVVSHEVVYGEGVVARGWCVPDCGVPQQPEILARLHTSEAAA